MRSLGPGGRWSGGDRDRHREPSPFEAMAAERIVWRAVSKSLLFFGGAGTLIALLAGGSWSWERPVVPLGPVANLLLIAAMGFLGGIALGVGILILIRVLMLIERSLGALRRGDGARRKAEADERPWRLR